MPPLQAAGSALGQRPDGHHRLGPVLPIRRNPGWRRFCFTVLDPAVNSLQSSVGWTSLTETQPDGTLYQYGSAAGGIGPLQYIQNPAGARWTVTYDGSNRVSFVTDPLGRRTSFAYNATSGNLTSIQDPFQRLTTLTVNSSGDLVQILSPELCITSMVYDSSHFLPHGSILSATGLASTRAPVGRSVAAGGRHDARRRASQAVLSVPATPASQDLDHQPAGLCLHAQYANIGGASRGHRRGRATSTNYNWDSNGHLFGIGDGLGNITSFSY